MHNFKLGDIVAVVTEGTPGAPGGAPGGTKDWRYIVVGKGRWPGFVSAFCFKGDPDYVGETLSFQIQSLERVDD